MKTRLAMIAALALAGTGLAPAAVPAPTAVPALAAMSAAPATSGAAADSAGDNAPVSVGERALQARLMATYPGITQWDIVPLRPTAGSRLPASLSTGEWSAHVTRLGVRSAVWIAPGSASSRGELLWYSVAGLGQAVIATRRILPAAALDSQDGALASADLIAAACTPLDSPGALEGMRARITIREGEVICPGSIEQRPPVARGDEVTVRYASGPVVLTARAVAQGDGQMGKLVMVRSTASGDVFRAKVSGKAEVSVDD